MTPEQLQEIERVCHAALALSPAGRLAYLDTACTDDSIRREVESLLAAESDANEMFSSSGCISINNSIGCEIGETGPYDIREKLGEGGMGLVFRARQVSPVVREIALKIIRPGMASQQLVARFQLERQALAMMDHPNIARVLDAGATSQGLPYYAMELVSGRAITKHCDEAQLTTRQRVELMIPVCQAIQHAHQKGIIHRDIKPSNVLVTVYDGKPVPKVIDFGIAKAIESSMDGLEGATRPGMLIGTFEYVSPEQAEPGAKDVDTRTDIYSLGALLYQMLAGSAPLEGLSLDRLTYTEILRRIREEVPLPVSSRSNHREPELDWIVAKALDKDRDRRYASADGLARDLRRYLDGEPVEAGPPTVWYRVRKFAGRHRWGLGGATLLVALIVLAAVWMFVALRQQQRANVNAQALRDVVRKIIVERPAQLAQVPNRTALRGELMRDAEGALDALSRDASPGDTESQLQLARAYLAIGVAKGVYSSQGSEGDPAGAATYVRKSIDLFRKLAEHKPENAEIRRGEMEARSTWLALQYRLDALAEGERAATQIEESIGHMSAALRAKIQADWYLSIALVEWGMIRFRNNDVTGALELQRRAAQVFGGLVPVEFRDDPELLVHRSRMHRELAISVWMYGGLNPDVLTTGRLAVKVLNDCKTPQCRMRHAQAEGTLGEMEWAAGDRDEGVAALRRSVSSFDGLVAEDPANAVYQQARAQVRDYLSLVLAATGEGAEAVALARRSFTEPPAPDAKLPKGRERAIVHQITLGAAMLGAKRFGEAERELQETLATNRDWNPNEDLRWSAMHLLARALEAQGKFEEEVNVTREARELAGRETEGNFAARVRQAIAARDYSSALIHWRMAVPQQRVESMRALEEKIAGLDTRYGVLTGALLETAPSPAEVSGLRKLLAR